MKVTQSESERHLSIGLVPLLLLEPYDGLMNSPRASLAEGERCPSQLTSWMDP